MIRAGAFADIDSILEITKSCASHMKGQGIFQWNDYYPDRASFVKDEENKELFVYCIDEQVVSCISLCNKMDQEYITVKWNTENGNNLYVHRLAVHPNFQKKGVGKSLMDYAESFAKKNEYASVRLDTFSQNKRNLKFYESRGYERLEEIYFLKQSKFPFYCYELIL